MSLPDAANAPAPFRDLPSLVAEHARSRPQATALVVGDQRLSYATLNALADRVAAGLQQAGLQPGERVAICATSSPAYVAVFLGTLRAGGAVAPLAPSSTAEQLVGMAVDADARRFFLDAGVADALAAAGVAVPAGVPVTRLEALDTWLPPEGTKPAPVAIDPAWPFNLIYSSGTTGTPKGIVQSHGMRWGHILRAAMSGYAADCITLIATPLYSNTTLVSVIPTLAWGGCVILMPKFDALAYLQIAERERVTHTMLVPVQYQRLMARPEFDSFDLRSYRMKFCTSAPFHADLKADVLKR